MMHDWGILPVFTGLGVLLVLLLVLFLLSGKRRMGKKIGNAPMGTDNRASQIGRRVEETAQPEMKKQPAKKWGRGSEK